MSRRFRYSFQRALRGNGGSTTNTSVEETSKKRGIFPFRSSRNHVKESCNDEKDPQRQIHDDLCDDLSIDSRFVRNLENNLVINYAQTSADPSYDQSGSTCGNDDLEVISTFNEADTAPIESDSYCSNSEAHFPRSANCSRSARSDSCHQSTDNTRSTRSGSYITQSTRSGSFITRSTKSGSFITRSTRSDSHFTPLKDYYTQSTRSDAEAYFPLSTDHTRSTMRNDDKGWRGCTCNNVMFCHGE